MQGFDVRGVGDGLGALAGVRGGGGAGASGTVEATLPDGGLTAGVGYVVEEAGLGLLEERSAEGGKAGEHLGGGWEGGESRVREV